MQGEQTEPGSPPRHSITTGWKGPSMAKPVHVKWTQSPAEHDYPSAASFLSLLTDPAQVQALTTSLSQAATVQQHAKDILRAARLPLLAAR